MSANWFSDQRPQVYTFPVGNVGALNALVRDPLASDIVNDSESSGTTVAEALTRLNAMRFDWGVVAAPAITAGRFLPRTYAAVVTSEAQSQKTISRTCTIRGMSLSCATPLLVDTINVFFRLDGVSTALQVAFPPATPALSVTVPVLALAGQRAAIFLDQLGTEAASAWNFSVTLF